MKHIKTLLFSLTILAIMALPIGYTIRRVAAVPVYTCLPSCESSDGRFVTIAGSGLSTFVGADIHFVLAAPSGASSIEIGIFDGNTGDMWDEGTDELVFTLYADPNANLSTAVQLYQWNGNTLSDNAWFTQVHATGPDALSPSGNYFYHLEVHNTNPNGTFFSNFKVRTDGVLTLKPYAFSYMGGLHTLDDLYVIYPSFPLTLPTTYDGHFDFHVYSPTSMSFFEAWDGDLDYGDPNGNTADTDDPDTPNNNLPPWAIGTSAVFEGVAVGVGGTGDPGDDFTSTFVSRTPSVYYRVLDPFGTIYFHPNPSGNQEWEQFRLETNLATPADHYEASILPSGLWEIHMDGMDMHNLNAWRFFQDVLAVCEGVGQEEIDPCKPKLNPYNIGDTVFNDLDGDGVQDGGEPGISGVTIALLDNNGNPVNDIFGNPITAVTDGNGNYVFNVEPKQLDPYTNAVLFNGVYTVQVNSSNFGVGQPLEGMTSTTGGETQTDTVIDANVLTYDFGYNKPLTAPGTVTIGYWKNHPEAWPVTSITIGGRTYTREQAIEWMKKSTSTDKTISLFAQLVAAKLNVLVGNEASCISSDIAAADAWMALHPVGSKVSANSPAWKEIENSHNMLDKYNNGQLCAPHRD